MVNANKSNLQPRLRKAGAVIGIYKFHVYLIFVLWTLTWDQVGYQSIKFAVPSVLKFDDDDGVLIIVVIADLFSCSRTKINTIKKQIQNKEILIDLLNSYYNEIYLNII